MGERLLSRNFSPARPSLPAQARWTDRVALGTRIRNARLGAGLSEAALADGLVSVAYLSRIEANERRPSRLLLAGLTERLGIDAADLTQGEPRAAEGLRFELAHADFLLASGRFEEALEVSSDLAEVASGLGATEVGDAAQLIRATALAYTGEQYEALRIVGELTAEPATLATLAGSARVLLAASDFEAVISIGQRVIERVSRQDRLSYSQGASLAVSVCLAFQASGRSSTAIRLARLSLTYLPCVEDLPAVNECADPSSSMVSYRSFDDTALGIERGVAAFDSAALRYDIAHLQDF